MGTEEPLEQVIADLREQYKDETPVQMHRYEVHDPELRINKDDDSEQS